MRNARIVSFWSPVRHPDDRSADASEMTTLTNSSISFRDRAAVLQNTPWWGAMTVGMCFFTGVALINGWVIHFLVSRGAPETNRLLFDAFNRLLIGYGWLGNPLFLLGLTTLAVIEVRTPWLGLPRWLAWVGAIVSTLSWGRGIGSATGLFFLEPLIYANVPAFLWLGYVGLSIARTARTPS